MRAPALRPPVVPGSLIATGLRRAHGAAVVLDGVDLTVGPAARIAVVGPNGVGKSTLLRILAGLEPADAGRLDRSPSDLRVGYLAQEPDARSGETVLGYLARRTGVAAAEHSMDALAARLQQDPNMAQALADAVERWSALGGADLRARAAVACADVGVAPELLDRPAVDLSGGQTARVGLAAVLLARHDVLLLDEPTNDLDLDGLARLERFVEETDAALVMVSHDRAFLARAARHVVEIDEHTRRATTFAGGWSAYLEERAKARRREEERYAAYVAERRQLEEEARRHTTWERTGLRRVRASGERDKHIRWANTKGAESQAGRATRARRALDRLERTSAAGKPWEGWELRLSVTPAHRSGDVVARLEGAVVERGSFRLGPVDLEIRWQDRVAVTGPNGSGKSTLVNAVLGRLPLRAGSRRIGSGVVVGELEQQRSRFRTESPVLDAFVAATGSAPEAARSLLAKLGLGADHVGRPGASLSPGERTRADLGVVVARGVNLLVLDEPTNHLDLEAIEQLEAVLDAYEGTVVLVTHDRCLLEQFRATTTIALR